jgi:HD-GYP domain-containing protein (c-di-GMP phosphodiesterase class II)
VSESSFDDAPIARTNRINTSNRFQDYTNKLKNMIPSTIELPAPQQNAWKRRNPTLINLTDDTFPPLTPKKQKSIANNNTTTPTTDTSESSADLDLSSFTDELAKIRQENEDMQQRLQAQFQTAIRDLEIRMEQRTQSLVSTMGQTITQAVEHMNQQTARSDERLESFLTSFQAQADRMTAQMDRMMSRTSDHPPTSPNSTPLHRNRRRLESPLALPRHNVPESWEMDDDEEYDNDIEDDRSRTSSASCASHPQYGMDATTGGRK